MHSLISRHRVFSHVVQLGIYLYKGDKKRESLWQSLVDNHIRIHSQNSYRYHFLLNFYSDFHLNKNVYWWINLLFWRTFFAEIFSDNLQIIIFDQTLFHRVLYSFDFFKNWVFQSFCRSSSKNKKKLDAFHLSSLKNFGEFPMTSNHQRHEQITAGDRTRVST